MAWTNSKLVDYTLISPNKYTGRKDYNGKAITKLDRIAIHCVVGQVTVERLGQIFANPSRYASSNYGVGLDGRIGLYVYEKDTSWCTSSSTDTKTQPAVDNHGISIEVASDNYAPYAVTDAAYKATIKLVTDICKRNGITKITWIADKAKNRAYVPAKGEVLLTAHRHWAAKSCPGDALFAKFSDIQKQVQAAIKTTSTTKPTTAPKAEEIVTKTASGATITVATRFHSKYAKMWYTKEATNLYKSCSTKSTVLATLKKGTPVRCYGYYTPDGRYSWVWMYAVAEGKTGFVWSKYIDM